MKEKEEKFLLKKKSSDFLNEWFLSRAGSLWIQQVMVFSTSFYGLWVCEVSLLRSPLGTCQTMALAKLSSVLTHLVDGERNQTTSCWWMEAVLRKLGQTPGLSDITLRSSCLWKLHFPRPGFSSHRVMPVTFPAWVETFQGLYVEPTTFLYLSPEGKIGFFNSGLL